MDPNVMFFVLYIKRVFDHELDKVLLYIRNAKKLQDLYCQLIRNSFYSPCGK